MRLLLLLAFGLLATLLSGCSQPAAKPAPWVTYTSPDGKFTAKFPKEPRRVEALIPMEKPLTKVYVALLNDQLTFEIKYRDRDPPHQDAELLEKAPASMARSMHGTLRDNRPITLDQWQGRAFSYSAVENDVPMRHHVRLYTVGDRLYVLSVFGRQELLDDGEADEFLRSFMVNEK